MIKILWSSQVSEKIKKFHNKLQLGLNWKEILILFVFFFKRKEKKKTTAFIKKEKDLSFQKCFKQLAS